MTEHAELSEAGSPPSPITDRIVSLDVLRGFALLGILVPNIQAYAMVSIAYRNPTTYGDLHGINFAIWYLTNLLFEMKFMTLFSILFGAGIVIMSESTVARSRRSWTWHYRRMGILALFGLSHAYLLWYGDILFTYAVSGSVAYWFRRCRPRTLIVLGLITLSVASAASLLFGLTLPHWPAEEIAELQAEWQPSAESIQAELDAYRGSWWQQMSKRAPEAWMFQTFLLAIYLFWRACGLMLIGMALFKLGVLSAERAPRFYWLTASIGMVVGLGLVAYELGENVRRDFAFDYSFFLGNQINYWASLLVAAGYLSLVMLVCQAGVLKGVQDRLAAVGRMALTNYLAHSVLCTTLCYGHGFGYFGYLSRGQQWCVVFAIWALQLWWSPVWLRHFRFGPAEWVWRCLTYGARQPWRR